MYSQLRILTALVLLGLTGCNLSDTGGSTSSSGSSSDDTVTAVGQKVYIDEATLDEIRPYVSQCSNNQMAQNKSKKGKSLCVEICHRPPGNPSNSKTKIIPLSATAAHLKHGGSHHQDHDYVGPCTSNDEGSDDSGGGDPGTPPDDGGEVVDNDSGEEEPTDGNEIPPWCESFISIDADCDGLNDTTAEPYL